MHHKTWSTILAIGVVTTHHLSSLICDRYVYLSDIWEHWHSTFPHVIHASDPNHRLRSLKLKKGALGILQVFKATLRSFRTRLERS